MSKKRYQFLVNTATSCFLCFQEIGVVKNDINSYFSLRGLCRHLKIDLSRAIPLKDKSLLPVLPKMNVKVSLCQECEVVSQNYSELYRELEGIRMKLGLALEAINGKIMGAWKRPELIEAYRKKVEGNRQAKLHSWMVEKLRKEVMIKCHSHGKKSQPRIRIRKIPDFQPEPKVTNSDTPQIIQVRSLRPDPEADNIIPIQTPPEEEMPDIICVYMDSAINSGNAQTFAPVSVNLADIIPVQQLDPDPPVLSLSSLLSLPSSLTINYDHDHNGLISSIIPTSSSFSCQYCSKSFANRANRDRHIRDGCCPVMKVPFRKILPRPLQPPPHNLLPDRPPSNLSPPPPPSNLLQYQPPSSSSVVAQEPPPYPSTLLPQSPPIHSMLPPPQPPSPSKAMMMGPGGRTCTCILCPAQFSGKELLKSHIMQNHREDPRLRKMVSDISQWRSTSPNKTPPHNVAISVSPPMAVSRKRGHSEGNSFSCRYCDDSFHNQALLLRHERFYCSSRIQNKNQGPNQNQIEAQNPMLNQLLSQPLPPEPVQGPATIAEPESVIAVEDVTVQNMEMEIVNPNHDDIDVNVDGDGDSDAESDSSEQTLAEDVNGGHDNDETEWVTGQVEVEMEDIEIDPLA